MRYVKIEETGHAFMSLRRSRVHSEQRMREFRWQDQISRRAVLAERMQPGL